MNETLARLLDAAREDSLLREELLASEKAKDPMSAFCKAAQEAGFPVTVGELFAMGQEYTDNLLKSVNGGAEYPMEGWEDTYELFFGGAEIKSLKVGRFRKKSGLSFAFLLEPLT